MADENDLATTAAFLERLADTGVDAADIVDGGDIRVPAQKRGGFGVGANAVIADFAEIDDLEIAKFFRQDVVEAHFALFMAAIGKRAGKKGDLLRLVLRQEAADEIAGQTTVSAIVDTCYVLAWGLVVRRGTIAAFTLSTMTV